MGAKYFGAAVRRREDPRFLRGEARFVDDVTLPGLLHAAFLRSPHAHATLAHIRTEAARTMPGVVAVFMHADLARWMKPLPLFGAPPPGLAAAVKFELRQAPQYALAKERVRYVGEIVAMVVATDRARAEDALAAIEVEYTPLPASVDMLIAGEPGAPLVHPEWGTNVAVGFRHAIGDADRALASAEVVIEETFRIQRYVGMPLEGRGVVAVWDRRDGTLTTWNSTQVSHFVQQGLVSTLELPPHRIRVIAPDLGGGFGTKASGYAEDALIPIAARVLGRPVKWVEDRREHMMSAAHARHQTHTIRLGARRDGTILGLVDRIWLDLGAYNAWGVVLPYNTVAHLIGPHRIRDMQVDVKAVVTNKTPNAPYRGAGRPETVFAMDRAVDCLARTLRLDPADVRRRNYIRPDELPFDFGMPYRDGNPMVYDSGDFPAALESALAAAEYDRVRKEQDALRARGVWRGIGISGYVEGTAIGPFEGARVTLDAAGRVQVATGAVCSGQGHETSFAQVAADALGVPLDWVTVTGGDTAGAVRHRHVREPQRRHRGQLDRRRRGPGPRKGPRSGRRAARSRAGGSRDRGRAGVRARRAVVRRRLRADRPGGHSDVRKARRRHTRLRRHRLSSRADRHVRERGARRRRRRRSRDRRREADPLRRRARLRQGHQSDHRGRPGARRRRPGCGRRAVRGHGVRRRGAAAGRQSHGLRGAGRERPAADRDDPPGIPLAA